MSILALEQFRDFGTRSLTTGAIKLYQTQISSRTKPRCRLTPTCSNYAQEAIARFGPIDGLGLTYKRIKRCNRQNPIETDPVPTRLAIKRADQAKEVTDKRLENLDFETVSERATPGSELRRLRTPVPANAGLPRSARVLQSE